MEVLRLNRKLDQLNTQLHHIYAIIAYIWVKGIYPFTDGLNILQCEDPAIKKYEIGWNQFMEGKFAKSLTSHQEEYYLAISSWKYDTQWAVFISKGFIIFLHFIWKTQNDLLTPSLNSTSVSNISSNSILTQNFNLLLGPATYLRTTITSSLKPVNQSTTSM